MTALILALLVTGASLLVAEAHVPSYGVLGITGVALLATGAVLGVDAAGGSVLLALALVVPIALAMTGLVAIVARKALSVAGGGRAAARTG